MSTHARSDDQWIDDYVDGALSPAERREFERRVATDSDLGRRWQAQQRLDATLTTAFVVPPATTALLAVGAAAGKSAAAATGASSAGKAGATKLAAKSSWILLAAASALLASAAIVAVQPSLVGLKGWGAPQASEPPRPRLYNGIHVFQAYRDLSASGFAARYVPEGEEELAGSLWRRCDQGLLLRPLPPGVRFIGLAECGCVTCNSAIAIFRVDDKPVIVVLDATKFDPLYDLTPKDGLHGFRTEIGRAALYEVSPFAEARVSEFFYDPQKPAQWYHSAGGF